jgi:hypothetical protein
MKRNETKTSGNSTGKTGLCVFQGLATLASIDAIGKHEPLSEQVPATEHRHLFSPFSHTRELVLSIKEANDILAG